MLKTIKKIILKGMRFLGLKYMPPKIEIKRNRMAEIKRLIPETSPFVIDGGAHTGEFIDLIFRIYPSPIIRAYEPIPNLVDALQKKYSSSNVLIREAAIGPIATEIDLHITEILPASSILKSGMLGQQYHINGLNIRKTISVSQVRLDAEINQEVDILKLDLQGYELEALKGAEALLNKTKLILVEIEFIPLYENQPLFADIDEFLREKGFHLFNLYELYTHQDGQLTSGDAIYLNNSYF